MVEITHLQSDEKENEKFEKLFCLLQNCPFAQTLLMKWRIKIREDEGNWKYREEGRFEDVDGSSSDDEGEDGSSSDNEGEEEVKTKDLERGLQKYYRLAVEKVT